MGKLRVDFGDVEKEIRKGGGRSKHVPEGDYLVKIVEADVRKSERTGGRYISWRTQVVDGEHKGTTLYGTTSLKKEALWSLRNLIHAVTGKNVAGRAVNFDPENLYGKIVGASVEDNEYTRNGQTKITSQISTFFPRDEYEAAEDEDEDEDEEDEEEEDEDEEEDLEEVDVEDI